MDFDVQPLKTTRKECKTPAAMPGFLFEQTMRMAGTAQRTLTPVATSRQETRNVTLKKTLHARGDIPVMHTLRKYTMVCVDNLKKNSRESRIPNRQFDFRSAE